MKKIALVAIASSALVAAPALAGPTSSESFTVTASVPQECSIEDIANQTFAMDINTASGSDALTLTASKSGSDRFWMSCNYAAAITVNAGQLVNEDGASIAANDAADFTNVLVYDLTLENQTKTSNGPFSKFALKVADDTSSTKTPAGAFHENANFQIDIKTVNNPKRPVAGTYTAVTTISLGAV